MSSAYVVSVRFSGSPKDYDYFCPADRRVAIGDVVKVATRRGLADVIVVDVKADSPRATAFIEPEQGALKMSGAISPSTALTQCAMILDHMAHFGGITPADAIRFGCYRLSARIYDLRRSGYEISAERVASVSGGAFARYSIMRAKAANKLGGPIAPAALSERNAREEGSN